MCASFTKAMSVGKAVHTPTSPSLADGLTVPTVGVNALATGAPLIDKIVTVSEAWIAIAILRLIELEKVRIVLTSVTLHCVCRRWWRARVPSVWRRCWPVSCLN